MGALPDTSSRPFSGVGPPFFSPWPLSPLAGKTGVWPLSVSNPARSGIASRIYVWQHRGHLSSLCPGSAGLVHPSRTLCEPLSVLEPDRSIVPGSLVLPFYPQRLLISASPPTPIPRLRDLIFNDKLNLKTLIPPTKCPLSTHLLRWDQMTHNKALSLVRYPHFSHKKWGLKDVQRPAGDYTTEGLSSLRHSGPKTLFPSPLCLKKTQNAF